MSLDTANCPPAAGASTMTLASCGTVPSEPRTPNWVSDFQTIVAEWKLLGRAAMVSPGRPTSMAPWALGMTPTIPGLPSTTSTARPAATQVRVNRAMGAPSSIGKVS
ncbi:hypothetical protein [Engelhardtia mirabilis]|uniref:hypothetical protein n=1 Tax=Engelhardtia mirabilis TaxID=2528011 RepID=UPI0011A3327C